MPKPRTRALPDAAADREAYDGYFIDLRCSPAGMAALGRAINRASTADQKTLRSLADAARAILQEMADAKLDLVQSYRDPVDPATDRVRHHAETP